MKLIECPRDAMQGIKAFIPTEKKVEYLKQILQCGFDTVDIGSFVSPHAIPQMADTPLLLASLANEVYTSKLLVIVANLRGAQEACMFEQIHYLGYPFSVSETFQKRNTNTSIEQSLLQLDKIKNISVKSGKELVVYLSMAFGNPYADSWGADEVLQWAEKMVQMEIKIISLADTIGVAKPSTISYLFKEVTKAFKDIEFGAHFHTTPQSWKEKITSAYEANCRRFDGAIKGFGGCPMADDKLVGNMPTERLIEFCDEHKLSTGLNMESFNRSFQLADAVFSTNHE
jgi:hydroxymethylglutaryl-CoA lyase